MKTTGRALTEALLRIGAENLDKDLYIDEDEYICSSGDYFLRVDVGEKDVYLTFEPLPYEQFRYKFVGPRRKPKWWEDLNELKSKNLWPTGAGEPQS